jgi:tetratricopeptide (TPR) repeat protein
MSDDLLAEKEFLLRSLRDLEDERAAGDIDDDDYATLKQDYTARAAAVLKALGANGAPRRNGRAATASTSPSPTAPSRIRARTVARRPRRSARGPIIAGVVVLLAVLVGWAVASSAGDRTPGQNISGTAAGASSASAGSVDGLLAQARDLVAQQKVLDAVKVYDQVLKIDPNQVEALAYRGWLLHLANLDAEALTSLNKAVASDPTYPDAHFFRGEVLCTYSHDQQGAVIEFQAFLKSNPTADFATLVQQRLQNAQSGGCATVTTNFGPQPAGSAPATTPTTKP